MLSACKTRLRRRRLAVTCQAGPEFTCWVFDGIGLGDQVFLKNIYKSMVYRSSGACWLFDASPINKKRFIPHARNHLPSLPQSLQDRRGGVRRHPQAGTRWISVRRFTRPRPWAKASAWQRKWRMVVARICRLARSNRFALPIRKPPT